jgi:hypothetical protein
MTRLDEQTLTRAHLLSVLTRTPDEDLAAFAERTALPHAVTAEQARLARNVLDALARILEVGDADSWRRLEEAERVLADDGAERPSAPEASPTPKIALEVPRRTEVAGSAPTGRPAWPSAPPVSAPKVDARSPLLAPNTQGSTFTAAASDEADSTIVGDALAEERGRNPIPFRGENPQPPSSAREETPHPSVGETAFLPAIDVTEATTPFGAEAVAPMPLARYAALLVTMERATGAERVTKQRQHGIDGEEDWHRVVQEMGRYLRRNQRARAELEALLNGLRK